MEEFLFIWNDTRISRVSWWNPLDLLCLILIEPWWSRSLEDSIFIILIVCYILIDKLIASLTNTDISRLSFVSNSLFQSRAKQVLHAWTNIPRNLYSHYKNLNLLKLSSFNRFISFYLWFKCFHYLLMIHHTLRFFWFMVWLNRHYFHFRKQKISCWLGQGN